MRLLSFLLALFLAVPAYAIDYEASVKALSPTGWWKGYYGNTISTTTLGASSVKDFSNNSRVFTQATAGYQAVKTRGDNRENRLWPSDSLLSVCAPVRVTTPALNTLMEDGTVTSTHYAVHTLVVYNVGNSYTHSFLVRRGVGSRNVRASIIYNGGGESRANIDLGSCTLANTTGTTTAWTVGPTVAVEGSDCRFTGTSIADGTGGVAQYVIWMTDAAYAATYSGNGASTIIVTALSSRNSLSDSTYVATTTAPAFRGVSGLSALHFDGIDDVLGSTTTIGNVFAAGAKTVFVVTRFNALPVGSKLIFYDGTGVFRLYVSGTALNFGNYSGAAWQMVPTITVAVDTPYIIMARHDTGNLYLSVNNGTPTTIASGNTDGIANPAATLLLGGVTTNNGAYEDITEYITFNTALSVADRQTVYDYLYWTLHNPWVRVEVLS